MSIKVFTRFGAAGLGLLLVASLAACGDDGEHAGVATLTKGESASSADDEGGDGGEGEDESDKTFEDAMLEFTKCMRENGVDMPDPTFDGEGGGPVVVRRSLDEQGDDGGGGASGAVNGVPFDVADGADFEKANEACQPLLDEAMKDAPKPSAEEMAEMQDEMLEFAACMREHGIDMPDPTFEADSGGRTKVQIGGGSNSGGTSFSPEDEDFQEAQEACAPEGGRGGMVTATPGAKLGGGSSEGGDE